MGSKSASTRAGDEGFTLIELLVAMTVMVVVMSVATAGIVSMYRSAGEVDARSAAQAELGLVLQRLDREVRYARGVSSTPATGASAVDFLTIQGTHEVCVQLRVVGGVLSQRTWAYGGSGISPTGWKPLASGLTLARPFTYVPPDDSLGHQRLRIDLRRQGEGNQATFTALNTDRSSGNDYCAAGRTP
ncbi:prepilin-type N-terminal cleavage/methylation domain-containing protein [Nucisporomicrobium flavum]|jgi:prepilin-type N-terminal cleavage/methylation domain-containing protein|uniref:prepilin-type N-terminal cleavage/methylation domain-containing protein n=1 Tax=Nucisporomicrobium flavum TaxID=2785915 RepID=UPI0018F6DAB6|nr:prepilin-type N-terminal cleavage/methylation domain-containing protein [Nucisporomicrobium flavum]